MTYISTAEQLREALIDLERLNINEHESRIEAEALLAGLQALTAETRGSNPFPGLLDVLRDAIGFENAFVLAMNGDRKLHTVASTAQSFSELSWPEDALTRRLSDGAPIAFFDISESPEWKSLPVSCRENIRSALHVRLRPAPHLAILVCTHSKRGFFGRRQLHLATRFAPLASQALQNLESSAELEEARRLAEKRQLQVVNSSKMAALGEMAGGIAHEINTPLAAIQMISGQLQELVAEDPLDRQTVTSIAKLIETTAARIAKIILTMRAFSRKSENDPLAPEPLSRIVEDTKILCSEKFKNHHVQLDIAPIPPELQVQCRANEVSQILLNLLNNAFDALESEPTERKWVKIDVAENADEVELTVTDGGPGIPPEALTRLFQPFFTTKKAGKGTGIGLSISKRFAENQGGDLFVDENCENTRFVLRLKKS